MQLLSAAAVQIGHIAAVPAVELAFHNLVDISDRSVVVAVLADTAPVGRHEDLEDSHLEVGERIVARMVIWEVTIHFVAFVGVDERKFVPFRLLLLVEVGILQEVEGTGTRRDREDLSHMGHPNTTLCYTRPRSRTRMESCSGQVCRRFDG